MLDILCLGNALIDCFLTLTHPDHDCRVETTTKEICFPLGAKIPVNAVSFSLGGNACNLAVGMSRLSLRAGLVAEIGNDIFSSQIKETLQKEKVDISQVLQVEGASSFAVGINVKDDRTLFVEHVLREHDFPFSSINAKMIYVTSLGKEWKGAYERVLAFATEYSIPIAFNPGTPQFEEGVGSFRDMLHQTSILIVNKDEAKEIIKKKTNDVNSMLLLLQTLGPKTVVITDGKNGSYAIDKNEQISHVDIVKVPVVERTGTGDAYATGFLAGVLNEESVRKAMYWGTVNASSVVGKVGAQAGLLDLKELKERAHREFE